MDTKLMEIAQRIKGLREILEWTPEQMAVHTDVPLDTYQQYESGTKDFGFTFLLACARTFGVDIVELLTGEKPKLSHYTVIRAGKGLPMQRRVGFTYEHLAYHMQNKLSEPYLVTAPYTEEEQDKPIHLSRHKGQEFNYVMKGSLKLQLDDHIEVLGEGDSIYYDSSSQHGMIAIGGSDCTFLAIVIKSSTENQ